MNENGFWKVVTGAVSGAPTWGFGLRDTVSKPKLVLIPNPVLVLVPVSAGLSGGSFGAPKLNGFAGG